MQSIHLQYFLSCISKLGDIESAAVFVFENGKWKCHQSDYLPDQPLTTALKTIKSGAQIRRLTKPARALIRLSKSDVSVVIPIRVGTRDATLKDHAIKLEECLIAATSTFRAHHDELTSVLNRHGIRDELQRSIFGLLDQTTSKDKPEQQFSGNSEFVLFALDIDRFKSVNDTYGHEAGDIVLSVFAERMNTLAIELSEKYSTKFIFGRPGGEEFELISIGTLTAKEISEIGDILLNKIRQPELPNREEIEHQIAKRDRATKQIDFSTYPNRITASIGVARRRVPSSLSNIETLHSTLRNEADAALYRSKDDGRNCVRIHDEIRRKHGKVFAFHSSSSLVTIDIGSNVGVENGSMYRVCFPPFTGDEKIQHEDNTSKVLGKYPTFTSAKLAVIDVQKETSTCVILDQASKAPIPAGSRLQYVFNGSNLPLISQPAIHNALVDPLSSLASYIQEKREQGTLGVVCAVSGKFADEVVRPTNEIVEELITSLHLLFPAKTRLFHSAGAGLFAVMPPIEIEAPQELQDKLQKIADTTKILNFKMQIGAVWLPNLPIECETSAESIIFYARAALLQDREDNSKNVCLFDSSSPIDVMYMWRLGNDYENGIIDYQHFRKYGIESPYLDNQVGLIIIENDIREYFAFAEHILINAYENDPQPFLSANLGALHAQQERYEEAFHDFEKANEYVLNESEPYLISYAKCAVEVFKAGKIAKEKIQPLLENVTSDRHKPPQDAKYQLWLRDIKSMLSNINAMAE